MTTQTKKLDQIKSFHLKNSDCRGVIDCTMCIYISKEYTKIRIKKENDK